MRGKVCGDRNGAIDHDEDVISQPRVVGADFAGVGSAIGREHRAHEDDEFVLGVLRDGHGV